MLLLVGTFDLVRAYVAYTVVTSVVREVSGYPAGHITDSDYLALSRQAGLNLAVGLDSLQDPPFRLAAPITQQYLPDQTWYVSVTATYQFQALTPLVGKLWSASGAIPITAVTSTPVG